MHMGEWPPESTATFFPAASLTTDMTSFAVVGIAITAGLVRRLGLGLGLQS